MLEFTAIFMVFNLYSPVKCFLKFLLILNKLFSLQKIREDSIFFSKKQNVILIVLLDNVF